MPGLSHATAHPHEQQQQQQLIQHMGSSGDLALQLGGALLTGPSSFQAVLQQQCRAQQQAGQTNLAALLALLRGDPLQGAECYRAAGCLREALAVASARLLPSDPAILQLRRQYAAAITAPGTGAAAAAAAAAAATNAGAAPAATTTTTTTTTSKAAKPPQHHAEAAAANLLLLGQPADAARALATAASGDACATMHAAAVVAALAAAHEEGGGGQQELCSQAALLSLRAALLSGDQQPQQQSQQAVALLTRVLHPLARSCADAVAAQLVLQLALHLDARLAADNSGQGGAGTASAAAAAAAASHQQQAGPVLSAPDSGSGGSGNAPAIVPTLDGAQRAMGLLLERARSYGCLNQPLQEREQEQEQEQAEVQRNHGVCADAAVIASVLLPRLSSMWEQLEDRDHVQEAPQQQQEAQQQPEEEEHGQDPAAACAAQQGGGRRSSISCCCVASVWLWMCHLRSLSCSAEAASKQWQRAWRQHILPHLLQAVQLLQQQQQQQQRASAATPAATPRQLQTHSRPATGVRLRYSLARLQQLRASPLLPLVLEAEGTLQRLQAAHAPLCEPGDVAVVEGTVAGLGRPIPLRRYHEGKAPAAGSRSPGRVSQPAGTHQQLQAQQQQRRHSGASGDGSERHVTAGSGRDDNWHQPRPHRQQQQPPPPPPPPPPATSHQQQEQQRERGWRQQTAQLRGRGRRPAAAGAGTLQQQHWQDVHPYDVPLMTGAATAAPPPLPPPPPPPPTPPAGQ